MFNRKTFAELPAPSGDDSVLYVHPHHANDEYLLAKDSQGCPAVVVLRLPSDEPLHPLRLRNLEFHPSVRCELRSEQGPSRRLDVALLRCLSPEIELQACFIEAVRILVAEDSPPRTGNLRRKLNTLMELFRSLNLPTRKSIQGLWGELFLLATSRSVETLIEHWQPTSRALFDFVINQDSVEVKTCQHSTRPHHFKLDQLGLDEAAPPLIFSLVLSRSEDGISVTDLWRSIADRLSNSDHAARLVTRIGERMGDGWRYQRSVRFNPSLAFRSLTVYSGHSIPRPCNLPMPCGVLSVEFVANLAGIEDLNKSAAQSMNKVADLLLEGRSQRWLG